MPASPSADRHVRAPWYPLAEQAGREAGDEHRGQVGDQQHRAKRRALLGGDQAEPVDSQAGAERAPAPTRAYAWPPSPSWRGSEPRRPPRPVRRRWRRPRKAPRVTAAMAQRLNTMATAGRGDPAHEQADETPRDGDPGHAKGGASLHDRENRCSSFGHHLPIEGVPAVRPCWYAGTGGSHPPSIRNAISPSQGARRLPWLTPALHLSASTAQRLVLRRAGPFAPGRRPVASGGQRETDRDCG